ncbi:unnamed protein product, partial [Choristocarpus tenellus]
LPFWVTLVNATGAGLLASWATNPLDMAKLRLQVQRATLAHGSEAGVPSPLQHRGMIDTLVHIYQKGGITGLFKGSGARMAFHAPSTAITMALYEQAREMWAAVLR